jgi:hypothetical protein
MGSSWVKLNDGGGGATYTAGSGIAISGTNVISADTSILATQYDISQLGVAFPLLAPNSNTPQYSFNESQSTGIAYFNNRGVKRLSIIGADEAGTGTLIKITAGGGETGGSFDMQAGLSDVSGGTGGAFSMNGGNATGAGGIGGPLNMSGGSGSNGGNVTITAGFGDAIGGDVVIKSGSTLNETVNTGSVILSTGELGLKNPVITNSAGIQYKALTTAQRDALTGLTEGRLLWSTTTKSFNSYDGTSWHEIPKITKASATLNFPSTGAHLSSDLTITATGAAVGDAVTVAPGVAAIVANSCYTAWVSAANTVTVRYNHYGSGSSDPASAVFNVIVTKY